MTRRGSLTGERHITRVHGANARTTSCAKAVKKINNIKFISMAGSIFFNQRYMLWRMHDGTGFFQPRRTNFERTYSSLNPNLNLVSAFVCTFRAPFRGQESDPTT